jgi:hypothetical protein
MNDNLVIAIEQLSDELIISRIPDAPDHIFSRKFEKRMKKIIAGTYTPKIHITPKRITLKKLTVCLVAALLAILTFAMSVSAVRETIFNFFTQVFATHTLVKSEDDDVYPETIEEIYEITEGIEDYEMIQSESSPMELIYIYDNGKYRIRFTQTTKAYYDINVNTEGYDIVPIFIDDYEGIYLHMENQQYEYLSYDNEAYIISIGVTSYNSESEFGQNALINIAKSVQKVEN